ncbi:CotO family spore coat protein [Bacillus sp. FJAT-29814]|uniref:CotO family spore coat protein n=1 Tax=Bacillus sp. FJAT-29814 TaxID=1729688 RepID=UPI0008369F76|nr:CotO family spore coat protein [Bacillus sp. FJAT-29814]
MSKKKGKGPTLFINQSFSGTPSDTNMQEIFKSKLETEPKTEEIESPVKEMRKPVSSAPEDSNQTDRMHSGFNRVKPFKEMNVQERLDYLINFPKVLPPVPCVFYTADEKFLGTLRDADDHQITIETANQLSQTIPINQLKNIVMIGIKR